MEKIFDLKERSYQFGISVIKLVKLLPRNTTSYVIVNQLIRAATSVGANVVEGNAASSKKDFINFYNHALKSAVETKYWLRVLVDSGLANASKADSLIREVEELAKILGSIVSKSRKR